MSDIRANVVKMLDRIGYDKTTGFPGGDNSSGDDEKAAWEYMIASIMKSVVEKRQEMAKKEAEEAGVFGVGAIVEGSKDLVFDGIHTSITRIVNNAASRVDMTAFKTLLRKAGVSQDTIDDCELKATKKSSPAKRYDAVPK